MDIIWVLPNFGHIRNFNTDSILQHFQKKKIEKKKKKNRRKDNQKKEGNEEIRSKAKKIVRCQK